MLGGDNARPEYQGVLAALAGSDPKGAHALVTDLLSIAGINAVGGRSVGEIADRFLEQSALGASDRLPRDVRALIERFLAISGDPDEAAAELRALAARRQWRGARSGARLCSRAAPASSPRTASTCKRMRFSTAFGRGFDYYTGFVFELHRRGAHRRSAGRRRPLRRPAHAARRARADRRRSALRSGSSGSRLRRRRMSAPLVLAVPAKGRLQENAEAFFARAGLALIKPRGARDYRGAIAGLDGVEVAYLSAPKSPASSRRARCISASPARTWCASRSRTPTSAWC